MLTVTSINGLAALKHFRLIMY